jgi:type VI secretion system protein ImpC
MAPRIGFEFQLTRSREALRASRDSAMRILVMGDLSGRANRACENASDLPQRSIVSIDIDNFDQVLSRIGPSLKLALEDSAGAAVTIEFRRLDDFHPDRLYRDLSLFEALRQMRSRLRDPATFADAAEKLRKERAHVTQPQRSAVTPPVASDAENDTATLERLLGAKPLPATPAPARPAGKAVDIEGLIRNIVAPHIVPDAPSHQAQYIASVDAAIGEQMRAVLHDPALQALESTWRAVRWLTAELETGEQLKLYLLDVTLEELRADMRAAQGDPGRSGLYRLLVEQDNGITGGEPWSLLAGNYALGRASEDLDLLAFIGAIASQAGGPFLMSADARFLGCPSLATAPDPTAWQATGADAEKRWQALRQSSVASWLGVAFPRFLLRAPYGKRNDPVEQFDFEEMKSAFDHESFLWGNPAIACAFLIGRAFLDNGWDMELGDQRDIGDLPAVMLERDGEKQLLACAETYLSERAVEAILAQGLMPLLSIKNQNAARLLRFQSLAAPVQPLSGPWR